MTAAELLLMAVFCWRVERPPDLGSSPAELFLLESFILITWSLTNCPYPVVPATYSIPYYFAYPGFFVAFGSYAATVLGLILSSLGLMGCD